MGREFNRLAAVTLRTLREGKHPDGAGLYFQVKGAGRSWLFRYEIDGKDRWMGLGPFPTVSLAKARKLARKAKAQRAEGLDPIEERRADDTARRLARAGTISFQDAAERYIKAHSKTWKNAAHRQQWTATLKTYVYPVFGSLPVSEVRTPHVLKAIEPLWSAKPETASRIRGRIEKILDWAAARELRSRGDNPALWRGHLDKVLPPHSKVRKVRHQPALAYSDVPKLVSELREKGGVSPLALEFTIFNATRTIETIGAEWSEIDLVAKIWTVPGSRMKSGRMHRVPLTARAVKILKSLPRETGNEFVFIGGKAGRGLSNMAMLALLKSVRPSVTVHGFRASFKTWAREQTNFAREVSEACLAHTISDATEAAYVRGDLFQKRRRLMTTWARYIEGARK